MQVRNLCRTRPALNDDVTAHHLPPRSDPLLLALMFAVKRVGAVERPFGGGPSARKALAAQSWAYLKVCTLNRVIADIWGTLVFELAELLSSCFSPSCRVVCLRACGPSLQ